MFLNHYILLLSAGLFISCQQKEVKKVAFQEVKKNTQENVHPCELNEFLLLKNKPLQDDLFKKIDSVTAVQYPEGKAAEKTVNITPAMLNRYLKDIEPTLAQQTSAPIAKRTYHYKLVPQEFVKKASKEKNTIYIAFYAENCSFSISVLYSYELKEYDIVEESLVIYSFSINNGKIVNFERQEAG